MTPYMGLVLPTVGITLGPTWATELNAALTTVDAHNHTTGFGVPIPTAGINLNADLSFNNLNATNLRSARLFEQGTPLSGVSDLTCLYVASGNLYYNNNAGNQVRITVGAGLDASTVGGFGGDYGTSTASAFYTSATSTFTFWQDANKAALMDMGPITIHNTSTIATGISLQAPAVLGSSYNIVLPNAAPAVNPSVMQFDTSGNASFSQVLLNMLATEVINFLTPTGTIIQSGSTSTPAGYLYCDGTAYTSGSYPALYAAIGTAYGNTDAIVGHFNVPDLRGYFVRGQADGTGTDPDAASRAPLQTGGNSGDNVGSLQPSQPGPHNHSVTDPGHNHTQVGVSINASFGPGTTLGLKRTGGQTPSLNSLDNTVISTTGLTVDNLATSETRSKNVYVRYYIKT